MKNKLLFPILSFCLLISCASKFEYREICDCYSNSENENIDNKLNNCLPSSLNDSKDQVTELKKITQSLIKNCPKYQSDFNDIIFKQFRNPKPDLVIQKDSLKSCVQNGIEKAKNLSKLSEISIQENNLKAAMNLIDESLAIENNIPHSYWIKSFIFQKEKNYTDAIKVIETSNNFVTTSDAKFFNSLIILSIKEESKK